MKPLKECSWCEEWIPADVEPLEAEYCLGRYCSKQCVRDAEDDAERRYEWQKTEEYREKWTEPYNYED